jgi:hypothetical protein
MAVWLLLQLQRISRCFEVAQVPDGCASSFATHLADKHSVLKALTTFALEQPLWRQVRLYLYLQASETAVNKLDYNTISSRGRVLSVGDNKKSIIKLGECI